MTIEILSKSSTVLKMDGKASASSKAIISAEFSELKRDGGAFVHNVLLTLKPPSELTVLKKPTESSKEFSHRVRSHDLSRVRVSLYSVVSNAMQVEVPGTVLGYVYQLRNGKSIQEWLLKLARYKHLPPTVASSSSFPSPSRGRLNGTKQPQQQQQLALVPLHKAYTAPSSPVSRRLRPKPSSSTVASSPLPQAESAKTREKLSSGSISTSSEPLSQDDEEGGGESDDEAEEIEEEDRERDIFQVVIDEEGFRVVPELSVERAEGQEPTITVNEALPLSLLPKIRDEEGTPKGPRTLIPVTTPQDLSSAQNSSSTLSLNRGSCEQSPSHAQSLAMDQLRCTCRSASVDQLDHMGRQQQAGGRGGGASSKTESSGEEETAAALNRTASDRTPTQQKSRIVDRLMCACHSVLVNEKARSSKKRDKNGLRQNSMQGSAFNRLVQRRSTTPNLASALEDSEGDGFLRSRFHHTQIRKGKLKYSPRILEGGAASSSQNRASPPPPASVGMVTPSSSTTTMSSVGDERLGGALGGAGPSSRSVASATLPRRAKRNGEMEATGRDSPALTTPQKSGSTKSPKLLRIFHRRWQSSSAIKIAPSSLEQGDSPAPANASEVKPRKLHEMPAQQVAEELLLWDAEMLRRIDPQELEGGAWMKKNKHEISPGVMEMVRTFNELVFLVGTEIVAEETPQARAKVISQFIRVASKCYSIHNYNALKAILAALQSQPVHRLSKTWREVPSRKTKRFEKLAEFLSTENNSQIYRSAIQQHLNDGTSFVPFLGQFLTDANAMEVTKKMKMEAQRKVEEAKMAAAAAAATAENKNGRSDGSHEPDKLLKRRSSSLTTTSSMEALDRDGASGKPAASSRQSALARLSSTISVSAPTSPAASDTEDEENGATILRQIRERIEDERDSTRISIKPPEEGKMAALQVQASPDEVFSKTFVLEGTNGEDEVPGEEEEEDDGELAMSLSSVILQLNLDDNSLKHRNGEITKPSQMWLLSADDEEDSMTVNDTTTPDELLKMRGTPNISCLDTYSGEGGARSEAFTDFPVRKVPSITCIAEPCTINGGEDEIDAPIADVSESIEIDSGLPSSNSRNESRSISIPKSPSQVSLEVPGKAAAFGSPFSELSLDFSASNRKSRSCESLFSDDHFNNVLQRSLAELSRMSSSLQSFESDVFDEVESSLFHDFELSDSISDASSFNHSCSLNASATSSQFASMHQQQSCAITSTPIKTFKPKHTRGDSDPTTLMCKFNDNDSGQTPEAAEGAEKSTPGEEQRIKKTARSKSNPATTTHAAVTAAIAAGGGEDGRTNRRKRRISRSWRLRNRRRGRSATGDRGGDAATTGEAADGRNSNTPATARKKKRSIAPLPQSVGEYLHALQVASLGCSVGIEAREALRRLIVELPRVDDSENYQLSMDREPRETRPDL